MAIERKEPAGPPGAPEWMITFTDVISLLVTFFILLLTFSTLEDEKFHAAAGSIRQAFGHSETASGILSRPVKSPDSDAERPPKAEKRALESLEAIGTADGVDVTQLGEDYRITLDGDALFRAGTAELSARGRAFLRELAQALERLPNRVRIEGHADPSQGDLAQPLSRDRAVAVALALEAAGIAAPRLGIAAFGATRPLGRTAEDRARNRRIEVFVVEKD